MVTYKNFHIKSIMQKFINQFCSEHLKNFSIEIQENQNDFINLYVEKDTSGYKLAANIKTLKNMGFNKKDLECLLFHEKGHYELKHLELQNTFLVNFILAGLLGIIFFILIIIKLFVAINILLVIVPLLLSIYLVYDNLNYLHKMRKSEMQADRYACIYCDEKDFISMLMKMDKFYAKYQKNNKYELLYLLETHPSTEQRIKNIMNYSSIY